MALFPFKKNESEIDVILEVGSSSVAVAIAKIEKSLKPQIFFTYREPLPVDRERNASRAEKAMYQTLEKILKRAADEGLEHLHFTKLGANKIRKIHCILASPWFASETKRISITEDKKFSITSALVAKMISDEENSFLAADAQREDNTTSSLVALEKHIIQIKLNGYETAEPYNKLAREIELSVFLSVAHRSLVEKINEIIARRFSGTQILFHTSTLANFSALRDIYHKDSDFLLVEIGGEVSEIWLIRDSILHEAVSFPMGANELVRKVAQTAGAPHSVATSALKMHYEGIVSAQALTPESSKTVISPISSRPSLAIRSGDEVKLKWLENFNLSINRLGAQTVIPERLFLLTHNDFTPIVSQWVKDAEFTQFAALRQSFEVSTLSESFLSQFCDLSKKARSDPFLELHTIFVNNL